MERGWARTSQLSTTLSNPLFMRFTLVSLLLLQLGWPSWAASRRLLVVGPELSTTLTSVSNHAQLRARPCRPSIGHPWPSGLGVTGGLFEQGVVMPGGRRCHAQHRAAAPHDHLSFRFSKTKCPPNPATCTVTVRRRAVPFLTMYLG